LISFKNIIFQIIYSLHCGQKEYEFVHYDLHFKNILIKKIPKNKEKTIIFLKENEKKYLIDDIHQIKIADFGNSRIKIKEKIIFNPKNSITEIFNPNIDIFQISNELKKFKINWEISEIDSIEEEKKLLKNFKSMFKLNLITPLKLLSHKFFDSLIYNDESIDNNILKLGF
jgi:hypothetical protein